MAKECIFRAFGGPSFARFFARRQTRWRFCEFHVCTDGFHVQQKKKKKKKTGYVTDGCSLVISQSLNKKSRGTCLSLVTPTTPKWLK